MLVNTPTQSIKQRIAAKFSRAASQYDHFAKIQSEIARDAMDFLPPQCGTTVDIGCGTGRVTRHLRAKSACVIAIDLAFGMLQHAQQQTKETSAQDILWLQGDADHLPLRQGSVNTVFSSMVLQWCHEPAHIMREINRVLQPKGQVVLAIMCQDSFKELNQAWLQVDSQHHINQFHAANSWRQAGQQQGLKVELHEKRYQSLHPNIRDLFATIKKIGANVLLSSSTTSLQSAPTNLSLNRQRLDAIEQFYFDHYAEDRHIPLSYEIAFLHCIKS